MTSRRTTPSSTDKLASRRRGIHAAWSKTGLSDADYRAMLQSVADVTSSLQLDLAGADRVLNHINKTLGRSIANDRKEKPSRVRSECISLLSKVEALLADMKLPWAYGHTILRHQGVDRWEWASAEQFRSVIAALVLEQEKRQLATAVQASLAALGRELSFAPTLAKALGAKKPSGWNRDPKLMRSMLEHLQRVANQQRGT